MKCRENLRNGDKWPPDLGEFLALVSNAEQVDYGAAYTRCIDRNPKGDVEQYVFTEYGYMVRQEADDKARRRHRQYMIETQERKDSGVDLSVKALPRHSAVHTKDILNDNFDDFSKIKKGSVMERIAKRGGKI